MGSIAKIAGKAKRIKGRLEAIGNKRRKIIGGFLLIVGLPSWITNANFWFRIGRRGWPVIAWTYNTQVGRLCLTIVGLLLKVIMTLPRLGGARSNYATKCKPFSITHPRAENTREPLKSAACKGIPDHLSVWSSSTMAIAYDSLIL